MAELKTDYKDQLLDSLVNTKRVYNLVDADGNVVRENVSLEDVTVYSQDGDNFGAADINKTNEEVNQLNRNLTNENGETFRYGYQNGKRGVWVKEADTDVFVPFKSGLVTVTNSFSLVQPLLNVNGLNATNGFVMYTLYPIDFTDIETIAYKFQHIMQGTRNVCISITDAQLTTNAEIVANAMVKNSLTSENQWVNTDPVRTLDVSNINGEKYIGITIENYTSTIYLGVLQFDLNKKA